ncbi:hypothetical protein LIER_40761 [Lithospermum erythrorhizon]|uniref:Uncharacterized protein n=1 Tax=Lithospermum erythrorhizon TaxID=34254 RepID=A0AAV3R3H8_LITER
MEMEERGRVMEFPVREGATSCSPPKMPPRLRRRLTETESSSPSTVEEIQQKLRHADLRRRLLLRKFFGRFLVQSISGKFGLEVLWKE